MVDLDRVRRRAKMAPLEVAKPRSAMAQHNGAKTQPDIRAALRRDADGTLSGWAIDTADPDRRLVVELLGDGASLAIVRADLHVPQLRDEGHGDGCYGFTIGTDPRFPIASYELLLANASRVVAHYSAVAVPDASVPVEFAGGTVLWRGGLRLSGMVRVAGDGTGCEHLQVFQGSRRIEAAVALHAAGIGDDAGRPFDLFLPAGMADGHLHRLRIANAAGVELEGSPISLLAHPDGFRGLTRSLDQQALAFLDQLIPASLPFQHYRAWSRNFPDEAACDTVASATILGVVIIGSEGSEATLDSLQRQRGAFSIRATILETESADRARFRRAEWQAACSDLTASALVATLVIRAGTILRPHACSALVSAFDGRGGDAGGLVSLCVADHELFDPDGGRQPLFGPVFDYERLLSQGYAEGLFAVCHLPEIAGRASEAVTGYDVLFSALEAAQAENGRIVQIPRVLATVPAYAPQAAALDLAEAVCRHLARVDQEAVVELGQGCLLPLVHVRRPRPEGEVAIVIPTRDRLDLLRPCLASIEERTVHPDHRIVIVDNGSQDQETLDFLRVLSRRGAVVLRDQGSFNYARLNNSALREIGSPFACLLNNDVEVLAADWLTDMQSFFARESVGGVGARLSWPNGMLQHGGVVLGMNFAAGHAYDRYLASEPGYADGILAARECSALTAACLLVRRQEFLRVGGFDETAFPVAFNDVDFCLKLREAGKTLVWTPRAHLLHHESASRSNDRDSPAKRARFEKELAELRRRWEHKLMADDYYNPNLNLDAYAFTGLASPPRDRASRVSPVRF